MENTILSFLIENIQWVWFALAAICVIIEALTMGLTTVWFALGAFVLVFISSFPVPIWIQVLVFLLISTALLIFTRPIALKKFLAEPEKTNSDSLVGKAGLLTKQITKFEKGEIKISGKIWMACAENDATLAVDTECVVLRIEGVTLVVEELTY